MNGHELKLRSSFIIPEPQFSPYTPIASLKKVLELRFVASIRKVLEMGFEI
jgi:hypothetical protein